MQDLLKKLLTNLKNCWMDDRIFNSVEILTSEIISIFPERVFILSIENIKNGVYTL